ncbi:MAG: S9 family peptidase [Pseudomonadota bacterium]
MKRSFLLFGIICLAASSNSFSNIEAKKLIPIKDLFKNPENASYEISPNGKKLAWLAPYKTRMNILVDGKRITDVTDRDIASYMWKGNDYIVYSRDFGGDENYQLFSVNLKTGKIKALTPFKKVRSSIIDDLEDISSDEILIGMNKDNPELFDAYRLNIKTGEIRLEVRNFSKITSWETDHNSVIRIAIANNGAGKDIYYRPDNKSDFKKIMSIGFKDYFAPFFFTFDNKNIYAESNLGRDKSVVVEYDLEKKKEIKVIFQNSDVDVENLSYSKKRKVLTAASYYTEKLQRVFFDDKIKNIFNKVSSKLPKGVEINLTSNNKNEDKFIVRTYSDKNPGSYYLYGAKKNELKKLSDVNPLIKPSEMAEMIPVQYKARDGLTIHAYLTVPKVAKAKNLPVVINPHGGPWARDYWGFDRETQFLANRGYAILHPNFRGSTGYGKKFWTASFKQWGLKMQDDISDGVKWLIEQKIADPKRIAIYGGSYGGYATLAGMTFTPELYACGVDYVGISNLFTFMDTIPPYWRPGIDMWHEMVGDPKKDKKLFEKTSPIFHADRIAAPLMIAQGANDPRVNINESNQMVDALKKRGIKVPYLVKKNEGHGFRNEENRFEFYRMMEKFLGECIGNKKTGE